MYTIKRNLLQMVAIVTTKNRLFCLAGGDISSINLMPTTSIKVIFFASVSQYGDKKLDEGEWHYARKILD